MLDVVTGSQGGAQYLPATVPLARHNLGGSSLVLLSPSSCRSAAYRFDEAVRVSELQIVYQAADLQLRTSVS